MARWTIAATIVLAVIIAACTSGTDESDGTPGPAPVPGSTATTGTAAVPTDLPIVFALPDPALAGADLDAFTRGSEFFDEIWTPVGPFETGTDGLGPLFNAESCAACHASTGRRDVPPDGPIAEPGLVIRLSVPGRDPVTGAPVPEPTYGDQLQDRAIGTNDGEGVVFTNYVVQRGTYPDGTEFEILWPTVNVRDRRYGTLSPDTLLSARIGPQMIGMGLLEAVPPETILERADPADADGDGVSGRPNFVWNRTTGRAELGRFGWKANVATLELQVVQAFHGDLGITSSILPETNCAPNQSLCDDVENGGTSEVSDEKVADIVTYLRALAVPEARTAADPAAEAGQGHFREFGCDSCHTETLRTGPSDVAILSDREIHPYTDLLLHDLGFDMADDRPDFEATGSEWRTAPLWGLGLIPVEGDRGLLHDGRARTIEEAILWHGGEASRSRSAFLGADADARTELFAFLESL